MLREMYGVGKKWGQLSEGHRGFVAGVASCTVLAVFQGFVSEQLVLRDLEAEVFEEGWNASEEADALDAALLGLTQEGLDEEAACSVSCDVWADNDGPHFSEVGAVDMECCTADELAAF